MSNKRGFMFNEVKVSTPPESVFDLSFENKLTGNMADLIPVFCKEVIPGDKWHVRDSLQIDFAPLIAPIKHRVDAYLHYFFVPNRLIWDEWQSFISPGDGKVLMTDQANYVPPVMPYIPKGQGISPSATALHLLDSKLCDYLGLPWCSRSNNFGTDEAKSYQDFGSVNDTISQLPFRAYQLLYNEFYRDQNLTEPVVFPMGSGEYRENFNSPGPDVVMDSLNIHQCTLTALRKRCWEHDYFTSALPLPQRGADVLLPISFDSVTGIVRDDASIRFVGSRLTPDGEDMETGGAVIEGNLYNAPYVIGCEPGSAGVVPFVGTSTVSGNVAVLDGSRQNNFMDYDRVPYDSAALMAVTKGMPVDFRTNGSGPAITINDFRIAERLQLWLEKQARGGSRYYETLIVHFGVYSSDARIQRPEFIGGTKQPIVISDVIQTSETTDNGTPQGNRSGLAFSNGNNLDIRYDAEEHGFLIGILSVLPRTGYFQGLNTMWTRKSYLDYPWPEFANLGEQEIRPYELYVKKNADLSGVFGYIPRYSNWKYFHDEVHGDFRGTLDFWHLSRSFVNEPQLNTEFVQSNPSDRVFAVQDSNVDKLWCQIWHDVSCVRKLPMYGTPQL